MVTDMQQRVEERPQHQLMRATRERGDEEHFPRGLVPCPMRARCWRHEAGALKIAIKMLGFSKAKLCIAQMLVACTSAWSRLTHRDRSRTPLASSSHAVAQNP